MRPIEDRHPLDDVIDRVAKQLTRVEDDPHLASRIAASLPDRSRSVFGWWAPRLAMIAVVVAAAIVWGTRAPRESAHVVQPLASSQPLATPVTFVAAVIDLLEPGPMPLERVEPMEPMEPMGLVRAAHDFEFSLPSIEAVASLELEVIAPEGLPEDAPLTLAPLAIGELPMAENISPR
jgi:hypothetical protein